MPVAKRTSTPRNPIPAGLHHAICYAVIDLGTQPPLPNSRFGKTERKVMLIFEFPDERITVDRDGQQLDMPRACSKEFTLSLHEKAGLRKFLVSWRGRQFTAEEEEGFDLKAVLGVNAMVNVVHKDNGYEDLVSASPLNPKMVQKRTAENPLVLFDIEDVGIPDGVPEWVRNKIGNSLERSQSAPPDRHYDNGPPPPDDDDIPF